MSSSLLADRAKENGWWHSAPDWLVRLDQSLFDSMVASDKSSSLYWFADLMAHRWPGIVLLFVTIGLLIRAKHRHNASARALAWEFVFFLIVVGIGNILSDEIKSLFARLKPHVSHDIPGAKQPLSFPSNHSFNTATILGFWLIRLRSVSIGTQRKAIVLLTLIWCFTAWSRIYLGEHFPMDVIGGFFLGTVYGIYGAWLLTIPLTRLNKRSQR